MSDKEQTAELVVVDVHRYKKIKNALKDSEARYRLLFENMPIGIFRFSADGEILDANPALLKLLGYSSSAEAEQKNLGERNKNILKILSEFCNKIERQNEFRSFDLTWRKKDNTPLFIRVNASIVNTSDHNVLFYEGTVEDVSERKQAESQREAALEGLRESERRYSDMLSNVELISLTLDRGARITFCNDYLLRLTGWRREEVLGSDWFKIFIPPGNNELKDTFVALLNDLPTAWHHENEILTRSGERRLIHWNNSALRSTSGEVIGIASIGEDISERKQAESQREAALEALRDSLAGKEVLLKEVHHRVKNNLAGIIGLLQLQRETVTDPAAVAQFRELEGRIHSMALVHETLYQIESLARIDLQKYLEMLIAQLRAALDPRGNIRFSVAAAGVEMGLDNAIPCGLILNELITNAFKYAFPGNQPRPGEKACAITVSAEWDSGTGDGGVYALTVADNGVGLPADLDWATTKTLGLRLVRMLGQYQLKGQIELDRANGTSFRLVFASRQMEKR